MRALHIGKYYPPFAGGIEHFMGDLIPALRKIGVDVAAVVHDHPPSASGGAEGGDAAGIHRAPCFGSLLYAPVSPAFPGLMNRVIRRFDPDLLHIHMPNTSAFWCLFSPRARRIPWVVHWHSDVVSSAIDRRLAAAYRFYRPFEQRLLGRAAAILATSPPYLDASDALRPWREKCRVTPLGLDPGRLPSPDVDMMNAAGAFWRPGKTRVLAVGRLTYYKGHEFLIRAAARTPDLHVVIVGNGERKETLARLIADQGLDGRVLLHGFADSRRLQALLASCDCLCLPSLERTEAFGLVLLEAMRYARPAVASDVPGSGMGWVVRPGETGLLAPPGDAAGLADALAVLSRRPDERKRMGEAAARRFRRVFRIDRVAPMIRKVYEEIA
ncbi:MAG: glycosyltransferase [Desulfobacterales bacterium]|nr:glycosyltransferase [Desulfobacterales bacterium]